MLTPEVFRSPIHRKILQIILLSFLAIFSGVSSDELQILLELKSALQNSNVSAFESWKPDGNPCDFTGVVCDLGGLVTEIEMSRSNLAGILPWDSICQLKSLQKLDFGFNFLYGNVKENLSNCTKLQHLDLAFNSFSGTVPDFSALTGLKLLNLSDNRFTGRFPWNSLNSIRDLVWLSLGDNPFESNRFPVEILNLPKLKWLYISNISLEGEIPPSIGNLTELINLELSDNSFYGRIPMEITKLNKLWQLELYGNKLTGEIPIGLRNLTDLEYFDASSNDLEGNLTELKYLTNLVSLQLFYNGFSGELPPEFGEFKKLVNLSLYGNNLSGPLPQKLGSWAEFNFIDVSENKFSGQIPPDMCKRATMKKLLMLQNMFSGEIPTTYASCPSLSRFRVSNNLLSGEVPAGIWSLPNVVIIDLSMNKFEGPVMPEIGKAASLSQLFISNNRFSGKIPPEISNASFLTSIDASFNRFTGKIPSTIGELQKLNSLILSKNMFSGSIPDSLASCLSLAEMNLAGNSLSGNIPAGLGSLPTLNSLNLSENQLSGHIPATLSSLKLSLLDLSNNQLAGRIPQSLAVEGYNGSFAGNPGLCSQNIHYIRPCSSDSGKSGSFRTIISIFVACIAFSLACFICFVYLKNKKSNLHRPSKDSWDVKSFRVLTFTEQEILNSVKQEHLIGKGGSGSVYRVVLGNGKELAVKHIWNTGSARKMWRSDAAMLTKQPKISPEFDAEVKTLSSIRHVNVVKLYCSITSEDSSLLVYEYLPNGSLWDRLHTCEKMKLDWETRYDVALGAAKGLEYLHHACERPVIHRDVKSSNILLDEFFKPRIADFGLAKIVETNGGRDSTHVVAGTHGYIAPEYGYTCKVTEKSDVYSFGVVLMELVTGKRPIEPEFGESKDIVNWISTKITTRESVFQVIDPQIPTLLQEDVIKVLRIALLCTARFPSSRPSMRTVVQMLEGAEPCCRFVKIMIKDEKREGFEGKEKDYY